MSKLSSWLGKKKNSGIKSALSGLAGSIPFVGGIASGAIASISSSDKPKKTHTGKSAQSNIRVRVK